jgi:hypothetical protein
MPRKTIRIEPMNVVKEAPVEAPVEPLPERSNYIELSDDTLTAMTEQVKGDIIPVAKPKRTRRPKQKVEPELPNVIEEPRPVEPVPSVPLDESDIVATIEPAPTVPLDESDVVATGAVKPDKITCSACGKILSMKSFKYSHQKTCSGLKEAKHDKIDVETRTLVSSPLRKSEIKFDEEAPPEMAQLRRHPDHNTVIEPRVYRANMRKERMAKLFHSAI